MLETGRVLGHRYEIIQEIGSGGMANVYKAKDIKLGRLVAIKVLKQEMALDDTILGKFRKEALAAGSLNHPNIVAVYDLGHELGRDYIVMEYIDGITLKEYIQRRVQMSCEEVLKISIKIADALKAAHMNGIVHRDIKPQNIMVTPQGDVKVTDFGIAKAATSNTVTARGETLGSVHYLSPEQARGAEVDARSDLYSLGITIYEMATGCLPFNADTPVAVAMMQLHDPFPNPMERAPMLWDGLCDIIVKLTQKKPELRYQSADNLIVDMRRLYKNHAYRIQSAVRTDVVHEAPDAIILAEQEKERLRLERKRLQTEREERLKEKQRKRNWIITLIGMGFLLIVLLIVLLVALLNKAPEVVPEIESIPVVESSLVEEKEESSEESVETVRPKVNDYEGMDYEKAQAAIRDLNYYLNLVTVNNEDVEIGHVVSQSPKAGDILGEDRTITLYVSIGPTQSMVEIPSFTEEEMTEKEAEDLLTELGLKVGRIFTVHSSTVEAGIVVSQGLPEGTQVISGTSVDLTVSLGDAEPKEMGTKEGQITIQNPFDETTTSGNLKVDVIDANGGKVTVYQSNVSTSTFNSLGGTMKINYPAGTILVEVYLEGELLQSNQITE